MSLFDQTCLTNRGGLLARTTKLCLAGLLAIACLSWGAGAVHARGGRGNSYARKYFQQGMKMQQQAYAAYQKDQQEKQAAFMKRFDTNGNGKIDGKEKGPAQKYLRALELGKNPDKGYSSGFSAQPSSSSSLKPKAKK